MNKLISKKWVAVVALVSLLLAGCWGAKVIDWSWPQAQQQVEESWGERQIIALDLGIYGVEGQFYLDTPTLSFVEGSQELLWLDFSGEVEFSVGNGEIVYAPVPVELRVRTRLRYEPEAYVLLEPEVKSLEVEFPIEVMKSWLASSLSEDLSTALKGKPLFTADASLQALQQQGLVQLKLHPEGLKFTLEP